MLKTIEEAFGKLNKQLFKGQLPLPNITVDVTRNYIMRWDAAGNFLYIGAPFAKANSMVVLEAMVHEMLHVDNHAKGIIDVKANQYHNNRFLKSALNVGFYVRRHKSQRWSLTSVNMPNVICHKPDTDQNKKLLLALNSIDICPDRFENDIDFVRNTLKASKPSKSFFLKYQCKCPPPYNSIRSGRRPDSRNAVRAICEYCNSRYVCVS